MEKLTKSQLHDLVKLLQIAQPDHHKITQLLIPDSNFEIKTKINGVPCYLAVNNMDRIRGIAEFLDGLIVERNTSETKFIDLGSSTGNIMSVANILGYMSYGIEYQKPYVDYTNLVTNSQALRIRLAIRLDRNTRRCFTATQGNLLNSRQLKKAVEDKDVIYSWNPICDYHEMQKVLARVIRYMKPGATLLYYAAGADPRDLKFHGIYPNLEIDKKNDYGLVYIKKADEKFDNVAWRRFIKTKN